MRRALIWLVTLPIALGGLEAAHALANATLGPPDDAIEVFASPGAGSEFVPFIAALALGLVLIGLGGRVARRLSGRSGSVALPFACVGPIGFVLLELVEDLLHAGSLSAEFLLQPAFALGLVLQLPFALAGYFVARALLRLSDGVRSLIMRRRRLRRRASTPARPHDSLTDGAHGSIRGWAHPGRAPPPVGISPS